MEADQLAMAPAPIPAGPDPTAIRAAYISSLLTIESGWVEQWAGVHDLVQEEVSLVNYNLARSARSPEWLDRQLHLLEQVHPVATEMEHRLGLKLAAEASGIPAWKVPIERFQTHARGRGEGAADLERRIEGLLGAYRARRAEETVVWNGQPINPAAATASLRDPDRSVRENAMRGLASLNLRSRRHHGALFGRLVQLRTRLAQSSGAPSPLAGLTAALHTEGLAAAVVDVDGWVSAEVVPLVRAESESVRQRIGVDLLRPWDLSYEPGRDAGAAIAGAGALAHASAAMETVWPGWAAAVASLERGGWMDLEPRPGKAGGALAVELPLSRTSAIVANIASTDDESAFFHEMGHVLHAQLALPLPHAWQRNAPRVFSEAVALTMELLAGQSSLQRAVRRRQLRRFLETLAHLGRVVSFERWIYGPGLGSDPAQREDRWAGLEATFGRGADWSGLDDERRVAWYSDHQIFESPLASVDYLIALLAALAIWTRWRHEPERTIARLSAAMRAGGTMRGVDLLRLAGAGEALEPDGRTALVRGARAELDSPRVGG